MRLYSASILAATIYLEKTGDSSGELVPTVVPLKLEYTFSLARAAKVRGSDSSR